MQEISTQDIARLTAIIDAAKTITIVTHMNPDGDAFGSSLGLRNYILGKRGKEAVIVDADTAPDSLGFMFSDKDRSAFLAHSENKEAVERRIADSDTIICLDFNSFQRSGSLQELLQNSTATKVLIDHHISPDRASFDLVFSETEISSASELLFHILMLMPDVCGDASKLPIETGNALMTGLTTDTNNFANSVFPSTFQMASSLIAAGVDRNAIVANIYNRYRENRIRLMGFLLDKKLKISDLGVAYMVLDKKTMETFDTKEGETEGFVNLPLAIDKVRMSIFLKEDGDHMRVSIRSKQGTSANRCARQFFNGGGHENAAGGRLRMPEDLASVEMAEEYILKVTAEFFNGE